MAAFPGEPEFADKVAAEKQFWGALTFETLVFVIGGFLCYELLIKQKTFRRGITAPLAGAFYGPPGKALFVSAGDGQSSYDQRLPRGRYLVGRQKPQMPTDGSGIKTI